jgi:hypothetical protein
LGRIVVFLVKIISNVYFCTIFSNFFNGDKPKHFFFFFFNTIHKRKNSERRAPLKKD